jgi:tetratricopeptide (TPR) repeat protein
MLDEAMQDFTEAIKSNPKFAKAYYNRGVVYREKGMRAKAKSDFENAKSLDVGLPKKYRFARSCDHRFSPSGSRGFLVGCPSPDRPTFSSTHGFSDIAQQTTDYEVRGLSSVCQCATFLFAEGIGLLADLPSTYR